MPGSPRRPRWRTHGTHGVAILWIAAAGACAHRAAPPPGEPELVAEHALEDTLTVVPELGAVPAPRARVLPPSAWATDVGMDPAGLARVDSILRQAIVDGATPGASLAIGRRGHLVRLRGYGSIGWSSGAPAVTDSTLYDIASLTKVIGTATAAMMLADAGMLDLHVPIARWFPEWETDPARSRITTWHLLTHSSGMAAGGPARAGEGKASVLRRILAAPLEYAPGAGTLYSDWDIILVGELVERITGEPLDRFLRDRLFRPLGMLETGYHPLDWWWDGGTDPVVGALDPGLVHDRIAPTEVSARTGRARQGQVHDPIADAMGGVAGHSGLFSSARDLAVFAQALLDAGTRGDPRLARAETVRRFTTRQREGSTRALGWDTPGGHNTSAGRFMGPRAYGHTGFTGTSIWIDPERDIFVVLLTNRVHPTASNQKHLALRRDLHDAVMQAIIDTPIEARPR